MAENNSHNDPFDNLFKRNEDQIDIPFQEEDWLKLEKRLDAYDEKILYRKRLRYLAAAAILLIAMMGYLTSDNPLHLNQTESQVQEQMTLNDEPLDEDLLLDSSAVDRDDIRVETETGVSNEAADDQSSSDEFASRQSENSLPNTAAIDSGIADRSIPIMTIDRAEFMIAMDCRECSIVDKSDQDKFLLSENYARVNNPNLKADQTKKILNISSDIGEKPFSELQSASLSRFSIGVKAAPDLSTVGGLTNFQSPGYSFGFDIAYRVNEKLSISTGVARSVVRYKADGGGYDTPVYLSGGVVPDRLTGECVLLDIPLGLRVNVLSFSGSRFFATGSLSSYIMLNEAYRFDTENSYGGTSGYNYEEDTGTSHFMSNAGLSIGYEHDLNSKFSIRFEPQIKIPIREVGVTNVRLFSLGSFFSLSYNL